MSETYRPSLEQQDVIDHWGQGMAVQAGAGSGKTTTLVTKCLKLLERKPEARFIAVSFTERSASDLRTKLSKNFVQQGNPAALNQHWVTTIHGLCGSVLKEFPREAGFDGEESILPEAEAYLLWERALESLWYDEIPLQLEKDLETLLDRENRKGLIDLIDRVRELVPFGVLEFLEKSADPESHALQRISGFLIEKYQALKQRQGVLDFSDLEKGADRALESLQVRQSYHARFDLILIDEFQDTNPVQARILWRMARPDLSNLCVVGDPKQSIYRFRDADVSVFQEYCAQLPIHYSLTWNFRSRPGIIEYVNHICQKAFEGSEIPFEALVPQRPQGDAESVIRLDVQNPYELGQWILGEVKNGKSLDDMALLVRRIRGNESWLKALVGCGIPIAVGSGGLFWESPRVRELASLLRWWDNPANSMSGAVFLRAPWMAGLGQSKRGDHRHPNMDDLLDLWSKEDPTLMGPFLKSAHPLASRFRQLRALQLKPGDVLMALMGDSELEAELAGPLLGLWHRVENLSSRGLDFHAVVVEIFAAIEEGRREREVPAPKNQGSLTVLTLHGSKGLEFKNVILIDLGKKTRGSDAPLLFWDRTRGAYLAKRDDKGQREKKSTQENAWRELEKCKNLAESKRLFYVALTRAKEQLTLVCPELPDALEDSIRERIYSEDFWRGWIECAGIQPPRAGVPERGGVPEALLQSGVKSESRPYEPQVCPWVIPSVRARHSVTEWTLLSRCPRAYEWKYIRRKDSPEKEVESSGTESALPLSQKDLGSRVHKILEVGNLEDFHLLETEVGASRFVALPVIQWAKSHPEMLFPDEAEGREIFSELNFEVALGKDIIVGTMDRVVMHGRGGVNPRAELVDFKLTQRSYSKRALLQSYQTQMELYAWALTQLEPALARENVSSRLVTISSEGVKTVVVPRADAASGALNPIDPSALLKQARLIIAGEEGMPQAGAHCRFCEFQAICPAAPQAEVAQTKQKQQDSILELDSGQAQIELPGFWDLPPPSDPLVPFDGTVIEFDEPGSEVST